LPHLLSRLATQGTYELAKDLPSFSDEFACSFEADTLAILSEFHRLRRVIRGSELEQIFKDQNLGKSCDLVAAFDDCVLLIECKATTYRARLVTPNAIRNDNSATKVRAGITQLTSTARAIRNGALMSRDISAQKPIVGCICTFGELPYANSEFYWQDVVSADSDFGDNPAVLDLSHFARRPLILSSHEFEFMIAAMRAGERPLLDLLAGKHDDLRIGNWGQYFSKVFRDAGGKPLKVTDESVRRMFVDLAPEGSVDLTFLNRA
jgi:hypothetical protein